MNTQELIAQVDALAYELTELTAVVESLTKRVAGISSALKPQPAQKPNEPEKQDACKILYQSILNPGPREYFDYQEVADRFGVKISTVRSWVYKGKVKVFRPAPHWAGKIHISEIDRLLAERQETQAPEE
jgi:hypothetical protein